MLGHGAGTVGRGSIGWICLVRITGGKAARRETNEVSYQSEEGESMSRGWPMVKWERLKYLRWRWLTREGLRLRRYGRPIGMHLSSEDRFCGLDLSHLPEDRRRMGS